MATITLEYNVRNKQAKQMIEIIQTLGLATRKKTGLEEALEDVANGRLTIIHTPKNRKIQ
jgi:hypothetical protein